MRLGSQHLSARDTEPQGSLQISARKLIEPWNANVVSDAALPGGFEAIFRQCLVQV